MDYCGPRGIPYTAFQHGGPPIWDDLSRDSALAWQARENGRCGGCGQVGDDWWARGEDGEVLRYKADEHGTHVRDDAGHLIPDPNGVPIAATPAPFVVGYHACPACEALAARRKGEELNDGVHHTFRRRVAPTT